MKIHISGCSGYIGSAIYNSLKGDHYVRGSARSVGAGESHTVAVDWSKITSSEMMTLQPCDIFIHCAGLAHNKALDNSSERHITGNFVTTQNAYKAALIMGASKFIFLSTLAVYGDKTTISYSSQFSPNTEYGRSKLMAESWLKEQVLLSGMSLIIIRPAVVIGPDAPGNFGRLLRLLELGLPLPFPNSDSPRSVLLLDSLCAYIRASIDSSKSSLVEATLANTPPITASALYRNLAVPFGLRLPTLTLPRWLLRFGAVCLGRRKDFDKLFGRLVVEPFSGLPLESWRESVVWSDALTRLAIAHKKLGVTSGSNK
jgi:nucleoside-diphosphate-sugar epimerase